MAGMCTNTKPAAMATGWCLLVRAGCPPHKSALHRAWLHRNAGQACLGGREQIKRRGCNRERAQGFCAGWCSTCTLHEVGYGLGTAVRCSYQGRV